MRILFPLAIVLFLSSQSLAQQGQLISGTIRDQKSTEVLAGVTIQIFHDSIWSAIISNDRGGFRVKVKKGIDSIRFSMVGYHSVTLANDQTTNGLDILLVPMPEELSAVTIKPVPAIDIVKRAIEAISGFLPRDNFSSREFYREVFKDRDHYYSVAEAVFLAQFDLGRKKVKLKLEKGRSKEDVTYTRLFENYRPGGGPQFINDMSFSRKLPDFLDPKKIELFQYSFRSTLLMDDHRVYCIAFDQKPNVKQSLEKGKIYIDEEDFFIYKYEAENSPLGMPYIKNLSGTDKLVAEFLKIEFVRKSWKKTANFSRVNQKSFLSSFNDEMRNSIKQPKKNIDLDLTIRLEMIVTNPLLPFGKEISKDEEWTSSALAINLPTDFDSCFWSDYYTISPTDSLTKIISALTNAATVPDNNQDDSGWNYVHRDMFLSNKNQDSVFLSPIMKGLWEDESSAGLMYKLMEGDFEIETSIDLRKRTNNTQRPDRGFQQAGLMIRYGESDKENYFLLSLGTGGNANPKLFLKKTIDNKTRAIVFHPESFNENLKLIKSGSKLTAFYRSSGDSAWIKAGEFQAEWLSKRLQIGMAIFSHFRGQGPQMIPNMSAAFYHLKIQAI